jgi:hypothetical protein
VAPTRKKLNLKIQTESLPNNVVDFLGMGLILHGALLSPLQAQNGRFVLAKMGTLLDA